VIWAEIPLAVSPRAVLKHSVTRLGLCSVHLVALVAATLPETLEVEEPLVAEVGAIVAEIEDVMQTIVIEKKKVEHTLVVTEVGSGGDPIGIGQKEIGYTETIFLSGTAGHRLREIVVHRQDVAHVRSL
jgi:hypothetical protein